MGLSPTLLYRLIIRDALTITVMVRGLTSYQRTRASHALASLVHSHYVPAWLIYILEFACACYLTALLAGVLPAGVLTAVALSAAVISGRGLRLAFHGLGAWRQEHWVFARL